MIKHTPGKWNPIWERNAVYANGRCIAENIHFWDLAVISAAPELLEACKELLRNSEGHNLSEFAVELNLIREAVNKAEGNEK